LCQRVPYFCNSYLCVMSRAYADLPLHYGHVPPWLAKRMSLLGGAIVETIVADYGKGEVLRRLSDPCWFQALGCVLGMDWHSSGITTSVMGALKRAVNVRSKDLGIYICGGKGRHSRATPDELLQIGELTGLPGDELVRHSKLSAKVDNTAVQDGFQLYLHSFIVTDEGEWAVVQQGMNDASSMARRYHWHSAALQSFTETPHTFIYGHNQGQILNLTDKDAQPTKGGLMQLVKEDPAKLLPEIRKLVMPGHHDVRREDVDLKRLGSVLALAHERQLLDFDSLLLLEGVGPRTLQSLTLVSEVIHGTPSRFTDPARFSFAHGGKDGHPFPVPVNVYDETISVLKDAVQKAKIGQTDKQEAIKKLSTLSQRIEKDFIPNEQFEKVIERERKDSWKYGGRTVMGKSKPPDNQLRLFD
jgi:uncharacterized protein